MDWVTWIAGGGLGAAVTGGLVLVKKFSEVKTETHQHSMINSGLEYNTKELRKQLEDARKQYADAKAEMAHKNLEMIDLLGKRYEDGQRIARLETALRIDRAKANKVIMEVASQPALSVKELHDIVVDTGFGDIT